MTFNSTLSSAPQLSKSSLVAALESLSPYLSPGQSFIDPCAGAGELVDTLVNHGLECILAADDLPREHWVLRRRSLELEITGSEVDAIITNPGRDPATTNRLISHLGRQVPTWMLIGSAWGHEAKNSKLRPMLRMVVTVHDPVASAEGEVEGLETMAWHLFSQPMPLGTILVNK